MAAGVESLDSFGARASLEAAAATHTIYRLDRAAEALGCDLARLPFTLRILLENLLRGEDGSAVTADSIRALGAWQAQAAPADEVAFRPARVLLQDFTGVPAIVDLAAMR
ncbi:MAG: aconitate hydratase, partial [Chloroflexi bacterium]|nr:aconitate hydratase [Chloroflexota bacterium]